MPLKQYLYDSKIRKRKSKFDFQNDFSGRLYILPPECKELQCKIHRAVAISTPLPDVFVKTKLLAQDSQHHQNLLINCNKINHS